MDFQLKAGEMWPELNKHFEGLSKDCQISWHYESANCSSIKPRMSTLLPAEFIIDQSSELAAMEIGEKRDGTISIEFGGEDYAYPIIIERIDADTYKISEI